MGIVRDVSKAIFVAIAGALVLLVPSAAGSESRSRDGARLSIAQGAPLTLRGAGFKANERVRVSVASQGTRSAKRVAADAAGRFVVGFAGVAYDRCLGLAASAVGSSGSRAALKPREYFCPPN